MRREVASIVHVGIKGTVIALDRETGAEVWQTPLRGGGFVNLVLDGDNVLATTRGEVFCLDALTGRIKWNNPLTGFGWGLVTIATSAGSSTPAMAEYVRQQEQAQAAT